MSLYEVQRLFYELGVNRELHDRFQADRAAVLGGYEVTAEERAAILDLDVPRLSQMGVHPILLLQYARSQKLPTDDFLRMLRGEGRGASKERG
ncbi:MAG: hypothetical protein HYY85_12830 [Deltaproteobacteria bacterium]|nr:hypothetical protein [Deltaproteobacteria bacterium]